MICPRTETVTGLLNRVLNERFLYVRGTPACGKTTLANLILSYTESMPWLTCKYVTWTSNDSLWAEYLSKEVQISFNRITWRELSNTLFIIDEIQVSFEHSAFWSDFCKEIQQGRVKEWPMLIVFGSYGSPTDGPGNKTTHIYIYILYMPRTCVRRLPFSIGEGSRAALKGAPREHRGSRSEHKGARRRNTGARESTQGHTCLGAFTRRGAAKRILNWLL